MPPPADVVLADLGGLSTLPLELLFMITGYLDIPSAVKFTQVNRLAQFILWSDREYMLLRYCVFNPLSSEKFRFPYAERLSLQDINYHTFANRIWNLPRSSCSCVDSGLHNEKCYDLDLDTGQIFCDSCSMTTCGPTITLQHRNVQWARKRVKKNFLYRLPKGQLILLKNPKDIYVDLIQREDSAYWSRRAWKRFSNDQRWIVGGIWHYLSRAAPSHLNTRRLMNAILNATTRKGKKKKSKNATTRMKKNKKKTTRKKKNKKTRV